MMCSASRPPDRWSKVAAARAASVGDTMPGRCAIRKDKLRVWAAAYEATLKPSADDE
jgi:hypothetical protein